MLWGMRPLSGNLREVVFDTETTGLNHRKDRIVEIGCVELLNHVPTGETFHTYVNPEREMPAAAFEVHGLSDTFLTDQPVFAEIADDFVDFLDGVALIAHNAPFDLGFVGAELARLKRDPLEPAEVIDTVALARKKFPGAQATLDALCRRFEIDLSGRSKHGALVDAELLAAVYLELVGGRQPGLDLAHAEAAGPATATVEPATAWPPRTHVPSPQELEAHAAFISTLKDPLWRG